MLLVAVHGYHTMKAYGKVDFYKQNKKLQKWVLLGTCVPNTCVPNKMLCFLLRLKNFFAINRIFYSLVPVSVFLRKTFKSKKLASKC